MDTALGVALISGAVALASAGATARTAARNRRVQAELAQLSADLEDRTRARARAEDAAALMARYRDPVLRAAYDLQSRIYNIAEQNFLGKYYRHDEARFREYARDNTLYVFAEYLGWVEIVRQEVSFLDLGDEQRSRELNERFERVRTALLTDHLPRPFMIFHGQQRAIGELMIEEIDAPMAGPQRTCMGYAAFAAKQADPVFAEWFKPLRESLEAAASVSDVDLGRLYMVQRSLVALLDHLDPGNVLFPPTSREKLPLPDALSWFERPRSPGAANVERLRIEEQRIGHLATARPDEVANLLEGYRDAGALSDITRLAEELPPDLAHDPRIAQSVSYALNRADRGADAAEGKA
jgi:hypothetical protein